MAIRVAINGFGRIGRLAAKAALAKKLEEFELVAVNDLTEPKQLAYLFKYDTAYGIYPGTVEATTDSMVIDGKMIKVISEKEPAKLPWKTLNIDVVIESTGRFTKGEEAKQHLAAGAKAVVISAPSGGNEPAPTYLIGVNEQNYQGESVINNASCTTNSIAPMIAVLHAAFGVLKASMTTIHAYTADQNLQDGPHHDDFRRARAAAANLVPTTTGAAIATTHALPELEGKFDGLSIRAPVIVGSISDVTALLKTKTTTEAVNEAFRGAAKDPIYTGILAVSEEPLVSSDIRGNSHSVIVDLPLTKVVDQDLVKIFGWYDNEWGYSHRLVEQVIEVGKKLIK